MRVIAYFLAFVLALMLIVIFLSPLLLLMGFGIYAIVIGDVWLWRGIFLVSLVSLWQTFTFFANYYSKALGKILYMLKL